MAAVAALVKRQDTPHHIPTANLAAAFLPTKLSQGYMKAFLLLMLTLGWHLLPSQQTG